MLEEGPDFICSECLKHPPAFTRTFIVARYENAFRDLIHTFKYRRGMWLVYDLALYLEAVYRGRIQPLNIKVDLVTSVPMRPSKLRTRGYNQAHLLAKTFAQKVGLPYHATLLKRVHTGIISQTRLQRAGRLQNAKAAYALTSKKTRLDNQTILLIDDVMTTGATCNACANHLRNAGAKAVYILVLARPFRPY